MNLVDVTDALTQLDDDLVADEIAIFVGGGAIKIAEQRGEGQCRIDHHREHFRQRGLRQLTRSEPWPRHHH